MQQFLFDCRDAIRGLRRDRLFAAVVVLTLAMTIGATTAMFSIVHGVLLKPLPYAEPDRLVGLREVWREVADRAPILEVNERHFEYWRDNSQTFASMAQYIVMPGNLTSGGPAAQITVARSSASLFEVLGEATAVGRALSAADEADGAADVVVLGHALWRQRFGGDPAIVGQSITLDGRPFAVAGVLSSTFRLPGRSELVTNVDAVVPLRPQLGWAGEHNNLAVGRLKRGVTLDTAAAELDVLEAQAGEIATRESGQRVTLAAYVRPLEQMIVGRSGRGLWLLFAAIVAVLAIACSNLTNLALIRAITRARESAIRSALGADRRRLIVKAILDHCLLAMAGGLGGVAVAYLALRVFVYTAPIDLPRVDEVTLDAPVLAFAIAVSVLAGLLVSALPAWQLSRRDPQAVLRSGSAAAGQARGGIRARAVLTSAQVAICVTLLAVTGLLGASLLRVLDVEHGFNAEQIVTVPVALPAARYADGRVRIETHDRILETVSALPGVRSAASTSMLPMRGEAQVNFVVAAGMKVPREQQATANFRFVAPEFFDTLELPLVRGRAFTAAQRDKGLTPAVVSASMAARLWPETDPIGREFSRGIDGEAGFSVVGVAADARTTSIERAPPLMVYVPYWWQSRNTLSLLIKTRTQPASIVSSVRTAIARIDPEIAVGESRPLTDWIDAAVSGRRYQARLFIVFGLAALLIAMLGVYAVTAFSLSKRRREMNIRVALGARTGDVIGLFVKQTAASVLPGVIAGVLGALAIGGTVAGLLYEVAPRDPMVLATVAGSVAAFAIATSLFATRRGLAINPAAALREE